MSPVTVPILHTFLSQRELEVIPEGSSHQSQRELEV
jgi:hypothetical protein